MTDIDVMPQELLNSISFCVSVACGVREHKEMSKLGNQTSSGMGASNGISTSLCPADVVLL